MPYGREHKINKQHIGIVTKPIGKAGLIPLSNLIDVIYPFANFMSVITGCEGINLIQKKDPNIEVIQIKYRKRNCVIKKLLNHMLMQFEISMQIMDLSRGLSIWIFFLDSHSLLLPVLIAKLKRTKVIFVLTASIKNSARSHKSISSNIFSYSEIITYKLSDWIIIYSPNLINEWDLKKYKNKLLIAHEHVLDLKKFNIIRKLHERENVIGYIGRLSHEKGILNFFYSIVESLDILHDTKFIIGGDGPLRHEIEEIVCDYCITSRVKLFGWISHQDLPEHLNKLKLIVIPSYSEGLPNIMLEAMACGTPVLATPVGAIPNVIKDGETGFLMENNSPECIAANIIRALEHPDLESIVTHARTLIESEYTFERTVERWNKVFKECSE